MKKLLLISLLCLIPLGFNFKLKAQDKTIEHKMEILFSGAENLNASLKVSPVDEKKKTILVDWGEGNGVEEQTLTYGNTLSHTFKKASSKDRLVTIDGTGIKELADGYKSGIVGIKSIDAPELEKFNYEFSSFSKYPVLDFSHLTKLVEVSLRDISEFIAPASLEIFQNNTGYETPVLLTKLDVTRATHLKKIICSGKYFSYHDLSELDLSNCKELEEINLRGDSKHNRLTSLKGIKDIKSLKRCDLSKQSLDFNNLPGKQSDANAEIIYTDQKLTIDKSLISLGRVDLSKLAQVTNGLVEGTHKSVIKFFIKPEDKYANPKEISADKYTEENGVYTFKQEDFEGKPMVKMLVQITNEAYPNYGNGESQPFILPFEDTEHMVFLDGTGTWAKFANIKFEVYKQKKVDNKWVNDGEVKSGDKVEPNTHLSIKATWKGEDYIIKQWIINGKPLEKKDKKGNTYLATFNPLFYDMPETGALNVLLELELANLSWKINVPKEMDDQAKKDSKLYIYKKEEDGSKTKIYGQSVGEMAYATRISSVSLTNFVAEVVVPEGYEIKNWKVDNNELDSKEKSIEIAAEKSKYDRKIEVTLQKVGTAPEPPKEKVTVRLEAQPKEAVMLSYIKYNVDGKYIEVPKDGIIDKGSNIKVYVYAKDGWDLVKFTVNGEEYTGEIKGYSSKYIELVADQNLDIKCQLKKTGAETGHVTFAPKGDNATKAGTTITIIKQEKVEEKWTDNGEVKDGDPINPGQHLKVTAKFNDGYIIKNWLVNDKVLMHQPKEGLPFVSHFNPVYIDMPSEGSLKIEIELDIPNITWKYNLPEGISKEEKKNFKLHVSENKTDLFGQKMKNFVNGYYLENLNGKTIEFEAGAADGYVPTWQKNGETVNGSELTKEFVAGDKLDVVVTFVKDVSINQVDNALSIFVENNQICINAAAGTTCAVYRMNGTLVHKSIHTGNIDRIDVVPGMYIVTTGDKTMKVVVK